MERLTPKKAETLKPGDCLIYDPDILLELGRRNNPEGSRFHLETLGRRELDQYIKSKLGPDALLEYVSQVMGSESDGSPAPNVKGLPLEVTVDSVELHEGYHGWSVKYAMISLKEIKDAKFYHGLFMIEED